MDFDSLAWMGLPDDAGPAPDLHSPFNDTFAPNPFQSSNVRQSIDEIAVTGAQNVDQPVEVTAPTDFSLPVQPDPVIADEAPPLLFDTDMDTNNLETNTFEPNNLDIAPVPQDAEPFQFGDSLWDQPPPVEEASQAVSEPEKPDIAEMNGFAQLSFQDGEFLVTSTQVILGRDDKFAKKYQQEQKLARRRMKEGSRQAKEVEAQEALHEYQQEPSHPSAHDEELSPGGSLLEGRPARGLASAYSEQGGIVGLPEDEKRRRRNKKRRRNLLLSGQSSSTTSVAPANLHTFKYDIAAGDDDDVEDAQKPVFLPVHPNNPADIKLISREHLQIEYSSENSRWELKILGRSAYVKNEHYYAETDGADSWEQCEPKLLERDEVAILTHLTEIIVASLRMQFRLPRNTKVVSTFDSDDSELSDALSSPTQPPLEIMAGERSDSDSSDEDDVPLQSVKQKKLKQQKIEEKAKTGGKSGKKPVMLHLKKRKDSEPSPVKPPPATPKQPEKGKKPKKTVVAGSEPEPQPVVEEKKKEAPPPPPPMQLHLPPAPTQAQIDEQASDLAVAQALTQSQYQQPYSSAPPEASGSATSTNMMYAPQNPTEPVAFEPGSMLSEVPQDQLPEKRKGPGRPPKNGLISKRDMGIIRRKQKEFEKQGIPVPPLDELVRIVRTENKAKEAAAKAAARGEAPPPMAQNFPVMQSIEMSSQEPCATPTYVPAVPQPMQQTMGEGDYASVDPESKGSPKRQRTYRSPSPMKSKEECTEEELKKPNHTYYTTLDEILSEGPPKVLSFNRSMTRNARSTLTTSTAWTDTAGRVVSGITSSSMIDSSRLPSKAKVGCGPSTRRFHSTRKRRGNLRLHLCRDRRCHIPWRTAWHRSRGCSSMATLTLMVSLNTSSRLRNLVSNMRLHTDPDSRNTPNLELLRNMCQLDLSNLPTNSIHTRHSSPSSLSTNPTVYRLQLCRLGLLRQPIVKDQEHRTRNPASTILLTRSWRTAVTTSAHMPICNQPRCTKSKRMCSRNVSSGFRSFNVMAILS